MSCTAGQMKRRRRATDTRDAGRPPRLHRFRAGRGTCLHEFACLDLDIAPRADVLDGAQNVGQRRVSNVIDGRTDVECELATAWDDVDGAARNFELSDR